MMSGMRGVFRARFPKARAEPGNGGHNQIQHRSQHKDLKRAVPVAQCPEKKTQRAVRQAQNAPGDQTGNNQAVRLP